MTIDNGHFFAHRISLEHMWTHLHLWNLHLCIYKLVVHLTMFSWTLCSNFAMELHFFSANTLTMESFLESEQNRTRINKRNQNLYNIDALLDNGPLLPTKFRLRLWSHLPLFGKFHWQSSIISKGIHMIDNENRHFCWQNFTNVNVPLLENVGVKCRSNVGFARLQCT